MRQQPRLQGGRASSEPASSPRGTLRTSGPRRATARPPDHLSTSPVPMLVAVDCVIFGFDAGGLQVLLIRRGVAPMKGMWALPGGFVLPRESVDEGARRELLEETGVDRVFMEQVGTFGDVERDPRGRVVSVAYAALVRLEDHAVRGATDAAHAAWFDVEDPPMLAFDHAAILAAAREHLAMKARRRPIGFDLLPLRFTLSQLQGVYECVHGREIDKRNFRKKVLALGVLEELEAWQEDVPHRAARLYRFDRPAYDRLAKSGVNFEV